MTFDLMFTMMIYPFFQLFGINFHLVDMLEKL